MNTLLILLPGMDGTGSLFAPFVQRTPVGFDTRVIDYACDVGDVSEITRHAAAALPTDRPFVLVAESFSGPIALTLASRNPAGLLAVVLCATFVTNPVPWLPAALAPMVRASVFAAAPSVLVEAALLGAHGSPAIRTGLRRALASVPPGVLAERARACLRADARRELASCPVPLLVLRATRDRVVSGASVGDILRARPDAVLRDVAAPHLLLQVAPEAAWTEIERFVSDRS